LLKPCAIPTGAPFCGTKSQRGRGEERRHDTLRDLSAPAPAT
jgi:hypothetical protein